MASDSQSQKLVFDIITTAIKKLILITIIYFIGYIGWSVAWIYCLAIIYTITKKLTDSKREGWHVSRAMALGYEKDIILTKMQYLPSWVHFPDIERAEWLNKIIKQVWNKMNHYMKDLMPEVVEPRVQSYIKSFKFQDVILGHVPFRIDGVKVYEEDLSHNKIVMDLDLSYAGDCKITFQIAGMTGGLENFQVFKGMRGRLRIVMKPLISTMPLIGGLQLYFMTEPEVDFDLVGVVQILSMPGLRSILEKGVMESLNSMLLFPNIFPLKLSDEVEDSELRISEPEGVLRVYVIEAKHLMKKDISLIGDGKSDPYAVLTMGPKTFRTHTINKTVDPKWEYWCEFEAEGNSELKIHVWDQDEGSKDETLGSAIVNVQSIIKKGSEDMWIPLQDVMHGMIHLKLTWFNLTTTTEDLEAALQESQLFHSLHSSVLILYIESAKKLPKQSAAMPDSYAVIQIEGNTEQTIVQNQTCNPLWQSSFIFLIEDPKSAILNISICDKKSNNELGKVDYKLYSLLEKPNLELAKQSFALAKTEEALVICSFKLRIYKKHSGSNTENDDQEPTEFVGEKLPLKKKRSRTSIIPVPPGSSSDTSIEQLSNNCNGIGSLTPRNSVSGLDEQLFSGSIKLTLCYSDVTQKLTVCVHQVANVCYKNSINLPDPYVKLYLLPARNKANKRKTQVIKENSHPIFNETFEYLIPTTDLKYTRLEVVVATARRVIGKTNLGHVIIDLSKYDLRQSYHAWFDLTSNTSKDRKH